MGCCESKTADVVAERRHYRDTNSIELRAVSPEPPPPFVPGPVTNLKITLVTHIDQSPSISLSWCRPENCTSNVNIKEYYIKVFTTLTSGDSLNSSTNGDHVYKLKTFTTPGSVTKLAVTRKDGLIPLVLYTIEVKAKSQEETIGKEVQDSIYIHWHCRLPTCNRNRTIMNPKCTTLQQRNIYDFCSLKHKSESDQTYCLYPECTNKKKPSLHSTEAAKFPTSAQNHFCSQDHQSKAKTSSLGFFLEVDPSSKEFMKVSKKFTKEWSSKKGKCPSVEKVLAIVNPALEDAFCEYKKTLPRWHSKSKQCFHGTKLKCMLNRFQTQCTGDQCGICGISRQGFQQECIRDRFQRYGQGFYFAPNSSKSHDYCSKPDNGKYMAMLICQIAPGKEHNLRKNMTDLKEPPKGYHSVHGRRKSLLFSSDLNYDEIVVFSGDAACPRYVLLYK